MKIKFLLTGEGSSDLRLVEHLEAVLIDEGFSEVSGEAPDMSLFPIAVGRSVRDKVRALVKHYPSVDLIFVHRDSDNCHPDTRRQEIDDAAADEGMIDKVLPIIPVCMIETWLLTDADAIFSVAGKRNSRARLDCLPTLKNLEGVRDSKALLLTALCEASGAEGGKLRKFKKLFPEMRARLMYDLNPQGPVSGLPSYQAFRQRVKDFAQIYSKSF